MEYFYSFSNFCFLPIKRYVTLAANPTYSRGDCESPRECNDIRFKGHVYLVNFQINAALF
jgi:hypothetical protein